MMLVIELWFCSSLATAATTTATTSTTTAPEIFSSINFGLLQLIISVSFGLHTSFHPLSLNLLASDCLINLFCVFSSRLLLCRRSLSHYKACISLCLWSMESNISLFHSRSISSPAFVFAVVGVLVAVNVPSPITILWG